MKKLLHFAGAIWAVYTLLMLALTGLIAMVFFVPLYYLTGRKGWYLGHQVTRIWSWVFLYISGLPLWVCGRRWITRGKPAVYICNHVGLIDVPAAAAALKGPFHILSKEEVRKMPIIGYMLPRLHYAVKRSDKQSRDTSYNWLRKAIRKGRSVLLFPEGTRNAGPALTRDFYDGAFRLAIMEQVPLTVMVLLDSFKRMNKHHPFSILPGMLRCRIFPPIDTRGMTEKDLPALKEKARRMMESALEKVYGARLPLP